MKLWKVPINGKVKLKDYDPEDTDGIKNREQAEKETEEMVPQLGDRLHHCQNPRQSGTPSAEERV